MHNSTIRRVVTWGAILGSLVAFSVGAQTVPVPPDGNGNFYASPSVSSGGSGSKASPWDLQTALNGGTNHQVQAGNTIWLRGGTYNGTYINNLNGTASSPIRVRQYPGERATIKAPHTSGTSDPPPALTLKGSYTWFQDFEIPATRS